MAERSTHSLSVNPREPAAMLDVEGLTGRCSDPAIVVRKRRGGAMETTESGDPACAPLKEDPVSESSAGPPSAPSIAKAAENKGGLLDWPTSIHLETEEEGNFAEGKDGMLKDENASEGDGTQTKEVGEAEDSRSADQNLATRACTGETPIGRLPANSEVHTQIGDNVEGQDVPDNKKNVSAVSTILSESHPLSLEVSGAGPDMEERAYVGCEVAGNVQSATSLRSPILNIRGRGKVEPAFKQESFVMKDEQEELSQWMHSSNDLATVKEGTAASMTLTGFKLEELTGKMPKYPFIPGLGTGERETTEIDQTTIPETELKNIPDVENETSKRVDSEEQVNDVDMEALGWSATDIGKVQEAQIRKFTEESLSKSQEHQCESMVENYEDLEEASKIGILLPDPLRVNFNPVGNKPMGKGLETGDEEENLSMGLLPIGSYQAINRSKPDLMVSDLKLIPYEVEDSISTVDSLEELIDDLEIEEEFEVEEGTDFKSNSKSSSMEMGRSDGDAQVMELESQVVGLELPVLDVLTNAQTASGQQAATRVEMKKDLEALTEGAETPSITEIKQEDEEGVKFQNEESVSGVRSETHPLPQVMGHQELLGGEIMGAENQGTELSSKQESDIEKSAGHLTPAVTALVEAAGGDPKAKRGFSDLESKDCAKNPEAERHREEEPRAEEAVCEPAAEDIETNVLSAEPVAETGVEGVGERSVEATAVKRGRGLVETQGRDLGVETQDRETVAETQDREIVSESQGQGTASEMWDWELVSETQDWLFVSKAQNSETVSEFQDQETASETQGQGTDSEEEHLETVLETQHPETVSETQDLETVSETQDLETVSEIQVSKTVSEIQDSGALSETQDLGAVSETQDSRAMSQTQDSEAVSETQDRKNMLETQDRETVSETQDSEIMPETHISKTVSQTYVPEILSQTQDPAIVSERQERETVSEMQGLQRVSETQVSDIISETQERETVSETQDQETV
ncbi:hypothetical protein scyTo_0019777, partial [Scyliorhinus torazame]|nr:hypothetical protein [Scyliorhinus torazame]